MATTTPSIKTFLFCGFIKISFSYFVIGITSFVGSADSLKTLWTLRALKIFAMTDFPRVKDAVKCLFFYYGNILDKRKAEKFGGIEAISVFTLFFISWYKGWVVSDRERLRRNAVGWWPRRRGGWVNYISYFNTGLLRIFIV